MYESPIDIIYNDIQYKVVEEFDKNVVSAVQSYGIDVNKEELLKALRYDRQQYEKGYADAKEEYLPRWTPCSKRLPDDGEEVFVYLYNASPYIAWVKDGHWYTEEFEVDKENEPKAWMPLPRPYGEKRME